MIFGKEFPSKVIDEKSALKGRKEPIIVSTNHLFFKTVLTLVLATMLNRFVLALVVFGGVEKRLWEIDGVISTSVGYAGGFTENPTYEEVCSGQTGHTEVVLVTFDILSIKLGEILKVFWEMHDPTQGFGKAMMLELNIVLQSIIVGKSKKVYSSVLWKVMNEFWLKQGWET